MLTSAFDLKDYVLYVGRHIAIAIMLLFCMYRLTLNPIGLFGGLESMGGGGGGHFGPPLRSRQLMDRLT